MDSDLGNSGARFGNMNFRQIGLLIVVALVIVGIDQLSKFYMEATLAEIGSLEILPGLFSLTLSYNKGAAFGMFSGIESPAIRFVILVVFSALALILLTYFVLKEFRGIPPVVAWALIVGGGIGNIIDRIRVGMVTDFLDVYYGPYHWPTFNVADIGVTTGVTSLFLLTFTSYHLKKDKDELNQITHSS